MGKGAGIQFPDIRAQFLFKNWGPGQKNKKYCYGIIKSRTQYKDLEEKNNASNSISAWAPPQTPVGELTELPTTPVHRL